MAAKNGCHVLAALFCTASALRKSTKHQADCYSIYDGKPLLHFSLGTKEEHDEVIDKLQHLGCTEMGDRHAELTAICGTEQTAKLAEVYGQKVEVLNKDAGAFYRNTSGLAQGFTDSPGVAAGLSSTFYADWRDYATRLARVESAVANSGGAATLEQIGTSVEGRPIMAARFRGAGWAPGAPRAVIDFELHAREWIAGMSGVYAVEMAAQKARDDPSWLAGVELVIAPMMNPDGSVYSETTDRMWRKNRAVHSGYSCGGVDLNRNWDPDFAGWESTSSYPCHIFYHGTAAFSEPETQALKRVLDEAPVAVHLDVHSYTEVILHPWGYTDRWHPRIREIDVLGRAMQEAVMSVNGKRYSYGGSDLLYPASGVCPDYSTSQGAFGFTYELRPGSQAGGGFAPPPDQILPTAKECLAGIYAAVSWAKNTGNT